MYKLLRKFMLIGLALAALSCNDDFLKQNELPLYAFPDPLVISADQPVSAITLTIPDAGNQAFYIQSQPKWLAFDQLQGSFRDGSVSLPYRFIDPGYQTAEGYYAASLILCIKEKAYYQLDIWYGNFDTNPGDDNSPEVDEGKVQTINGEVVDACYDEANDQLIVATKNPNQLLIWQADSENPKTITLDKTPKCMEVSAQGKLLVGYAVAFLTSFDLQTWEPDQTYPLNFVPFDLAPGDANWCYISPLGSDFEPLRCLNLTTGELIAKEKLVPSHNFYGNSLLMKVPGKPLLAATRTLVTPSGLMLFDIHEGIASDTLAYWHEDLHRLWLFKDSLRMLTANGLVYFIPDYHTDYLNSTDNIDLYGELDMSHSTIIHMYEHEAKDCFFVAESNGYFGGNRYENGRIQQYDRTNLSLQKSYSPSMTVISQNGSYVVAYHEVFYVFANKAGTQLYAIRRFAEEFNLNQWSLETIALD